MQRNNEHNKSNQEIVFASSSKRKWYGFGQYVAENTNADITQFLTGHGLNLEEQGPINFHKRLETQIPNGDNEVQKNKRQFLGTFEGRPVSGHAQRGETESNVAQAESHNKVIDVAKHYSGQEVLIFSSDVVGENPNSDVRLGKPYKLEKYSKENPTPEELEEMRLDYISTYYKPGTEISHVHSFSMFDTRNGEQFDLVARIDQVIPHNVHAVVKDFYRYSGGSGVAQQLVDWEASMIEQISDHEMQAFFATLDQEKQKFWFYLHLIGVPSWQVALGIQALTEAKGNIFPVTGSSTYPIERAKEPAYAH